MTIDPHVVRTLAWSVAVLDVGLLLGIGIPYLRLAVRVRGINAVMDSTKGTIAAWSGVLGVILLVVTTIGGLASKDHASEPLTWRSWGLLLAYVLIGFALVSLGLFVRDGYQAQKKGLYPSFVKPCPDPPCEEEGDGDEH